MTIVCLDRLRRHAMPGSITVLAAVTLYVIVLLGVVAWAGIQEGCAGYQCHPGGCCPSGARAPEGLDDA